MISTLWRVNQSYRMSWSSCNCLEIKKKWFCCVAVFHPLLGIITWDFCPSSYMGNSFRFNNLTCPWTVVISLIQNCSVTLGFLSIPNKFVKKVLVTNCFWPEYNDSCRSGDTCCFFLRWRHKHCQAKGKLLCISASSP